MKHRQSVVAIVALLGVSLMIAACGTRGMRTVPQVSVAPPAADEAVIIFMRPSAVGEMYSTSLFELRPGGDRFVGILKGQARLAYRMKAGRTRFMLVSTGGADHYLDADLVGGKTYYATIDYGSPRAGAPATYLLKPLRPADQQSAEFTACSARCAWVENTEKSEAWGRNHMAEVGKRKARSLPVWEGDANRSSLTAADGR